MPSRLRQEVNFWTRALLRQLKELARDLRTFAPTVYPAGSHLRRVLSHELAAPLQPERADSLDSVGGLARMSQVYDATLAELSALAAGPRQGSVGATVEQAALPGGLPSLTTAVEEAAWAVDAVLPRLSRLAHGCEKLFEETDFAFLVDEGREVFHIGYNVTAGKADDSFYDLLASEARLASFIAIAKGDLPARHWFRLGHGVTPLRGGAALLSWSGSMFEYLMPPLVMKEPQGGILNQTSKLVVKQEFVNDAPVFPVGVGRQTVLS